MPKKQSLEDLSADELRWLLVEKRRSARQGRIERYRRTGRVVQLASDLDSPSFDQWRVRQETDEAENPDRVAAPRSRRRRVLDGFLLVIEISAVVGFVFILFNGLSLIQQLNREVVSILDQPTLTPTPLIVAIVLPSGHTPPDSPGGARFNDAEIPSHLRPLVQSLADVRLATASPSQAVRIQIPAIRVDAPVVQGDGWEQLKKGVGQHAGSGNPGDLNNLILSAHNDIFGEIFRDLDQLNPGDLVLLYTNQRSFTYIVVETKVVEPTQVEVMTATNQPTLTLISCYPYMIDDKRIAVIARLQNGNN